MSLPFFFEENLISHSTFVLSEETSKHVIQVLRMQKGEEFQLTNGKGLMLTCQIIYEHKKATEVKVVATHHQPHSPKKITAPSFEKNCLLFVSFVRIDL